MYICSCVCVCLSVYVRIYVTFQSRCVPSQQWCFSESPPPLAEWRLQDAETCTAARPSPQLDRYKLPHQDATLAQCPAAPYTDRPSPLAAALSTCSCKAIWQLIIHKAYCSGTIQILCDETPCRGGMSSDVSNGDSGFTAHTVTQTHILEGWNHQYRQISYWKWV